MAEIDMLKYKRQLELKELERLRKEGRLNHLIILSSEIPMGIFFFILFREFPLMLIPCFNMSLSGYLSTKKFLKENFDKMNIYYKIYEKLIKTETYNDCYVNYLSFIDQFATFLKQFGFKSSQEAIPFIQKIIDSGYLSVRGENKAISYRFGKDYIYELLGTRVLSGTFSCRHSVSFISDIMNTLGYKAEPILAKKTTNPLLLKDSKTLIYDHTILGIETENGKYAYCSVAKEFYSKVETSIKIGGISLNTERILDNLEKTFKNFPVLYELLLTKRRDLESSERYLVEPLLNSLLKSLNDDSYYIIKYLGKWPNVKPEIAFIPSEVLDKQQIDSYIKEADNLFNENIDLIEGLAKDTQELRNDITSKSLTLCQYSKLPIRKWQVK